MKFNRHKYLAVRTVAADGSKFPSKSECARYETLLAMRNAGLIRGFIRQPRFTLGVPENVYVSDFLVFENDGKAHAEDVKGMETPKFKRDKKLWLRYGPCQLGIIKGGKCVETVDPKVEGTNHA